MFSVDLDTIFIRMLPVNLTGILSVRCSGLVIGMALS